MQHDLAAYRELCAAKRPRPLIDGLLKLPELNSTLFPHQRHGVEFALRAGRAGLFYDTGLGKTAQMLEWGRVVVETTNRPVLMLAPLAVGAQHLKEAERIGVEATLSRFGSAPTKPSIAITNYERLEKFDPADYAGVILDESSILKSFAGKTTRKLIKTFSDYRFRLAGTATPAPNDHTELGQHSEFLGVMPRDEMLVRWFLHDSMNTKDWRLKGHAVSAFWDWVASWARCVSKPSDLGFSDDGFQMPELIIRKHLVAADRSQEAGSEKDGQQRLFRMPDTSATSIHREKRMTKDARAEALAELINAELNEPWVIWCDTDYDADAVKAVLPTANEVRGSMSIDVKEDRLASFSSGETRIMLSKPSICGYGLNWQHCARVAFMGLSFSYENFYQAVRRCWRFRQTRDVHVHIVCADTESSILDVVTRKSGDHNKMKSEMTAAMKRAAFSDQILHSYHPDQEARLPPWLA